jgi:hypothetical protein
MIFRGLRRKSRRVVFGLSGRSGFDILEGMKASSMRWFHFLWIVGLAVAVRGQTPSPSAHPFFKALEGRWTGEGELITRDQGELKIHEEWTGAAEEGGGFRMSGTRRLGEENHEFSWLFLLNPTSGLYECEYQHTGMEQAMRFEVSVTENRVELRAPLGDPGSELLITNTLEEGAIRGTVRHRDANGGEVSSGKVLHRRAS